MQMTRDVGGQATTRALIIRRASPPAVRLPVDTLTHDAARVRVLDLDGTPREAARVRCFVESGSVTIGEKESAVTLTTDADGLAGVDLKIPGVGASLLGFELDGDPSRSVYFDVRSPGVADRVYIFAADRIIAGEGEIEVLLSVLDFEGNPVVGADISLEAHDGSGMPLVGSVAANHDGLYSGVISTTRAGRYSVLAQDRMTRVIGSTIVTVTPSEATDIEFLSEVDPRAVEPFDVLALEARLVDRFGNSLPAHRMRASLVTTGQELPRSTRDRSAVFRVTSPGYSHVSVVIRDSATEIEAQITVNFAAAWMGNPGLVAVGDGYYTELYASPPPGRPADHATVSIEFDAKIVRFERFIASGAIRGSKQETSIERDGLLTIHFRSDVAIRAEDHPGGIHLGRIEWKCLAAGSTCFQLSARMSPSTPNWKLCVEQKMRLVTCICVNIVHAVDDKNALQKGKEAIAQLKQVISDEGNRSRCCPYELTVREKSRAIPVNDLHNMIGKEGKVETQDEWVRLGASGYIENGCINLFMVATELPGSTPTSTIRGLSTIGPMSSGPDTYGYGVLDPAVVDDSPSSVGAHELAHQLGLVHVSKADNLMYETFGDEGYKANLTNEQCATIFRTLDTYACQPLAPPP